MDINFTKVNHRRYLYLTTTGETLTCQIIAVWQVHVWINQIVGERNIYYNALFQTSTVVNEQEETCN